MSHVSTTHHLGTIIADGLGEDYADIDRDTTPTEEDGTTVLWVTSGPYRYKVTVEVADEN